MWLKGTLPPSPPTHTYCALPLIPPNLHLTQPRLVYVKVQLMAWVAGRGSGMSPPLYARRGGGCGRGVRIGEQRAPECVHGNLDDARWGLRLGSGRGHRLEGCIVPG